MPGLRRQIAVDGDGQAVRQIEFGKTRVEVGGAFDEHEGRTQGADTRSDQPRTSRAVMTDTEDQRFGAHGNGVWYIITIPLLLHKGVIVLQTDTAKRPGPVPLRLDEEWQERARIVAEAKQRALHWVLVEAVKEYVIREEKRESFKKEAHSRWEHYQQTGLHVTGEEAKAWMQKLVAGELVEPPECHA